MVMSSGNFLIGKASGEGKLVWSHINKFLGHAGSNLRSPSASSVRNQNGIFGHGTTQRYKNIAQLDFAQFYSFYLKFGFWDQ